VAAVTPGKSDTNAQNLILCLYDPGKIDTQKHYEKYTGMSLSN